MVEKAAVKKKIERLMQHLEEKLSAREDSAVEKRRMENAVTVQVKLTEQVK